MSQVECFAHGFGYQAFVCEHRMSNPAQQWFSDTPSEENKWRDAWCQACETVYQQNEGWNDVSGSKVKVRLLCHRCYESLRSQSKE